ncbi:MAG: hypothetical protein ACRC37_08225, partial [Lentisphaeria bacterium]
KVDLKIVVSPLLPDLKYNVNIFLAGVIYEDGSTQKELNLQSFDDAQTATVTFIKTAAAKKTAVCHHIEMYQNNGHIGRAY